ncbi:hypothetical protein EV363DRAFT_1175046 [Boletus edulis]|nr:hypothetical protein EV363DRAFT_1175046 [Boletus edulis]
MGKSAERSSDSAWDGSPTCQVGRELRGRVGTPRRRMCTAVGFARSGPKGSELRGTGMGMEAGCGGRVRRNKRGRAVRGGPERLRGGGLRPLVPHCVSPSQYFDSWVRVKGGNYLKCFGDSKY